MATLNEQIADLEIRHTVGIQRLSSSILRRLVPILNQADLDIVNRLLQRGATLEGSFTSKRLEQLLTALRELNHSAAVELGRELRGELRRLAAYEAEFQVRLINGVLPVRLDIVMPSAEMLSAVVTSRPFQWRLLSEWVQGLEQSRYVRLRDSIRLGMIQGETVDQIVRRVRGTKAARFTDGVMEVGRRAAETMVRTAVNHTANSAREILFSENADLVRGVQWVSTLDSRTCPSCGTLDGRMYPMGRGPRPPLHLSCRCATVPVLKSWRELGIGVEDLPASTRASINGQVPSTRNFESWLRGQSASVQDEALGVTRGKLFRSGGLPIDRFTNRNGDEWTLDELRQREAEAFAQAGL